MNTGSNAQAGYAASCPLTGPARLVYDPLGRSDVNFYLDTTNNKNILRQIQLNPPQFPGPNQAWGNQPACRRSAFASLGRRDIDLPGFEQDGVAEGSGGAANG